MLQDVLKTSFQWLSMQLSEEDHAQSIALLRDPIEAEVSELLIINVKVMIFI